VKLFVPFIAHVPTPSLTKPIVELAPLVIAPENVFSPKFTPASASTLLPVPVIFNG
jgi:hypothetical protein